MSAAESWPLTLPFSSSSQQRSKSEMLSRKSFSVGVPAVSMDELAAFAESYSQRARRADSQETRRFERSESRGGGLHHQDSSLEEYYTKRSRGNREPLTDSDRGWSYSPPRRRAHEEKHLPRLVSRTPGGSQKYDHSYLSSVLERKSRSYDESGDRCETPSKLSSQPSQRGGGTYYAWSPPSTYKPEPSQQQSQQSPSSDQEDGEDTLPPYSERELSRGPSYRAREQAYLNASDKKRKKEPKKTVRPCLVLLIQIRWGVSRQAGVTKQSLGAGGSPGEGRVWMESGCGEPQIAWGTLRETSVGSLWEGWGDRCLWVRAHGPVHVCHAHQRHLSPRMPASEKHPAPVRAREGWWDCDCWGGGAKSLGLGPEQSGLCKKEQGREPEKVVTLQLCLCRSYICLFVRSVGALLLTLFSSLSSQNDFPTRMSLVVWSCGHVMLMGWIPRGDCGGKDTEQQAKQAPVNLCSHQPRTQFKSFISSG